MLNNVASFSSPQCDDATSMALARKSEDILVAYAAQVLYFGDFPGALTLLGAALILTCILLAGSRKVLEARIKGEGERKSDVVNHSPINIVVLFFLRHLQMESQHRGGRLPPSAFAGGRRRKKKKEKWYRV